jgi:NADH:ubiquinone oxidoreductase subunit 3 (subunit A)
MSGLLLTPPVSFIIILIVSWLLSYASSFLSFKTKHAPEGLRKPYASGEDTYDNMARPDYSQFFVFAFFFTLAHVATLIITTMPKGMLEVFFIAITYVTAVLISLVILFRS